MPTDNDEVIAALRRWLTYQDAHIAHLTAERNRVAARLKMIEERFPGLIKSGVGAARPHKLGDFR
jgi:hypothetical protein